MVTKILVKLDETKFIKCPFCGREYEIELDKDTGEMIISHEYGKKPCKHLDPEYVPLEGDMFEIYFIDKEKEG